MSLKSDVKCFVDGSNSYNKTYYLSESESKWFAGAANCLRNQMEPFSLDTKVEHDYFFDNFLENSKFINGSVHVGAISPQKTRTQWFWLHSAKLIDYELRFSPGQPDNDKVNNYGDNDYNADFILNRKQACMEIYLLENAFSVQFGFNDIYCDEVRSTLCQITTLK